MRLNRFLFLKSNSRLKYNKHNLSESRLTIKYLTNFKLKFSTTLMRTTEMLHEKDGTRLSCKKVKKVTARLTKIHGRNQGTPGMQTPSNELQSLQFPGARGTR